MASMSLPLGVNRSLRASFTVMQVLVRSHMIVTYPSREGITSSTTATVGALQRAWKAAVTSSNARHAPHAVFCQSGQNMTFDRNL